MTDESATPDVCDAANMLGGFDRRGSLAPSGVHSQRWRSRSARLPLLALGLGLTLWAWQTYGWGGTASWRALCDAVFWANVPAVAAGLRRRGPEDRKQLPGPVSAVLPSVAMFVCAALAAEPGRHPGPIQVLTALVALCWGWLVIGYLTGALVDSIRGQRRSSPVRGRLELDPPPGLAGVVRILVGVACFPTAVGIAITLPVATSGLLEQDRLGLLAQLHAVVAGYGDPTASRLVVIYSCLLTGLGAVYLLAGPRERRASTAPEPPPGFKPAHPAGTDHFYAHQGVLEWLSRHHRNRRLLTAADERASSNSDRPPT